MTVFEQEKKKSMRSLISWILLGGIPLTAAILLYRTGILGHLFYYTAAMMCAAVFIFGAGLLIFGFGPWMKKTAVLLISVTAGLSGFQAVRTAVLGEMIEPFTVYIGGGDTYDQTADAGRTDVNIAAAVNPEKAQVVIVSVPRDTYVYNPALEGYDKLTHLGNNGIANTMSGIEELLNYDLAEDDEDYIRMDHYVLVNYTSFLSIIDIVGDITIYNPSEFTFTYDEAWHDENDPVITFPEGYITLNSEMALYYVRERKSFADGDLTRNEHQQIVLKAVIQKILDTTNIFNASKVLARVKECYETDLSDAEVLRILEKFVLNRKKLCIASYGIQGTAEQGVYCIGSDSWADVVMPDYVSLDEAWIQLNNILNGGNAEQEGGSDDE